MMIDSFGQFISAFMRCRTQPIRLPPRIGTRGGEGGGDCRNASFVIAEAQILADLARRLRIILARGGCAEAGGLNECSGFKIAAIGGANARILTLTSRA